MYDEVSASGPSSGCAFARRADRARRRLPGAAVLAALVALTAPQLADAQTAEQPAEQTREMRQPVRVFEQNIADVARRRVAPRPRRQVLQRGGPGHPAVFVQVMPEAEAAVDLQNADVSLHGLDAAAGDSKDGQAHSQPYISGPSFDGPSFSTSFPADPTIAVGPESVLTAVNGEIAMYSRNGARLWRVTDLQFFAPLFDDNTIDNVFDPKVLYDAQSSTFFILYIGTNGSPISGSDYLLAVSKNANPGPISGDNPLDTPSPEWVVYASESFSNGNWSDYPGFAVDKDRVYVTANYFSGQTNQFVGANLRAYDKSQFFGLNNPVELSFIETENVRTDPVGGDVVATLQPAANYLNFTPQYFVATVAGVTQGRPTDKLYAFQVDGQSPRTIRRYTLPVTTIQDTSNINDLGAYGQPPSAVQPGLGFPISSVDMRLLNATRVGNRIWTAHSVRDEIGNGAAVRWYQLRIVNATSVVLEDQGLIRNTAANGSAFIPGICGNANGDSVIVFARSSATEYAGMWYSWRLASDPLGLQNLSAPKVAQLGLGQYNFFRWGDYCTPALDPLDNLTVWGFHMYANANTSWNTRVIRINEGFGGGDGGGGLPCPTRLTVLRPEPNENWVTGTQRTITWQYEGEAEDQIDIDLVRNDVTVGRIASALPVGAGGFNWNVGTLTNTVDPVPGGGEYRIVLRPTYCDDSNHPPGSSLSFFRITEKVVANAVPPEGAIPVGGGLPFVEIAPGEGVQLGAVNAAGGQATGTKGFPPYSYRWSPSQFLDNATSARPLCQPSVLVRQNITYTVEVRDATGSLATSQVQVRIGNPLRVDAGPNRAFRTNGTVLLEGSATGGTPPYQYEWSPIPDPTQPAGADGANVPQPVARPANPTVYTLRVEDAVGAVATDTVAVTPGLSLKIINNPGNAGRVERSLAQELYVPGDQSQITAVANPGWVFSHWANPGVEFDNRPTVTGVQLSENPTKLTFQSGDVTVEAVYAQIQPSGANPTPGMASDLCGVMMPSAFAGLALGFGLMRRGLPGRRRTRVA